MQSSGAAQQIHPYGVGLLFLAAVVIPVMALIFFGLLEFAFIPSRTPWEALTDTGADLCNLSIGIVGGMFLNASLQVHVGQGAAVWGIFVELLILILTAFVMIVKHRFATLPWDKRAYICIGLGVVAVAVPSGMILGFGGP